MARPILKWAGGKRQIMGHIVSRFPEDFEKYHEPFAGGLSVFLHLYSLQLLRRKDVYLSDSMASLINAYDVVKTDVDGLCRELSSGYENTPDCFATKRKLFNATKRETGVTQAALFVYLNKTCFNGMYRENARGEYNVPYGHSKNPRICNEPGLRDMSTALADARLECCDYAETSKNVGSRDLVYLDPPYHGTFAGYTSSGFGDDNHVALKRYVDDLTARGAYVALSNSDTPFVRELYKEYTVHEIPVRRSITCKGADRKKTSTELLVTNY